MSMPVDRTAASTSRCGFTLIDLMVTIAVLAVAAAVIVPGVSNNDRLRLMAAANVMTSDLELAQVMTISFPNDPIVVRFDPDNRARIVGVDKLLQDQVGAIRAVTIGPDGAVYFATGNAIGRLMPAATPSRK